MARYSLKPAEVDAEPYRSGLEDAFNTQAVPVLVTSAGRVELVIGDWIVTKANGEREVVKAPLFHALYEPGPAHNAFQPTERVRRGIPMRSG